MSERLEETVRRHYCWACNRPTAADQIACVHCESERASAGWPQDELIGTLLGEKYELLHRIGAGGFGVVYLARNVEFGALRAVKVLHAHLSYDRKVVERFRREARAIYRLTASTIVRLEDFGEVRKGVPFMAMEYADGESLAELLHHEAPLPIRRGLRMVRGMAMALVDAAENGVLHRDLKPDNIRVVVDPRRGEEVKVLDFGISKILDERTSSLTGQSIIGTPEYMAPEVWDRSDEVDQRVDLFSLGVIAFQIFTGDVPWPRRQNEPLSVFAQMQKHAAPKLTALVGAGAVSPDLEEIVAGLLQRDPTVRTANAARLVESIDALGILETGAFRDSGSRRTTEQASRQAIPADTLPDARTPSRPIREFETAETLDDVGQTAKSSRRKTGLMSAFLAIVLSAALAGVVLAVMHLSEPSEVPPDSGAGAEQDLALDAVGADPQPDGQELASSFPGMIAIPAGHVSVGQSEADRQAQVAEFGEGADLGFLAEREVDVAPFLLDRFEVTVADFFPFQRALGRDSQALTAFADACPGVTVAPISMVNPHEPIRNVTMLEATLYCESQGRRLPTFEEWEVAARGQSARRYPWSGDSSVSGASNTGSASQPVWGRTTSVHDGFEQTAPVAALSAGASEWGVEGLGGNVAEWVSGPSGRGQTPPFFFRGGSYASHPLFAQTFAYQFVESPCIQMAEVGFRCARDLPEQGGTQ